MITLPRSAQGLGLMALLVLLLGATEVRAQQCAQELATAEDAYSRGRFDEAIKQLEKCLDKPGLAKAERQHAYRLLGLNYLGKDVLKEARASVQKLLEVAPNYEPDPALDPPSFVQLIHEAKAERAKEIKKEPKNPSLPNTSPNNPKTDKKGKGPGKWLLIGGGVVLAGVAAALLAGSGEDDGGGGGGETGPTQISEAEPNNAPAQAQALKGRHPLVVTGRADVNDVSDLGRNFSDGTFDDFEDWFTITTTRTGLDLSLTGHASDLDLYLMQPGTLNYVAISENEGSQTESIRQPTLPAGTYLIAVSIFDLNPQGPTTTTYTLTVDNGSTQSDLLALARAVQAPGGAHLTSNLRLVPSFDVSQSETSTSLGRGSWAGPGQTIMPMTVFKEGTYEIPLQPGWNIISNPFDVPLDWEAVQAANGIEQGLWQWAGHYQQTDRFLPAYTGEAFYFMNHTLRQTLTISPIQQHPPTLQKNLPTYATFTLYREGVQAASVQVGLAEDAALGLDPYDQFAPPGDFEAAGLRLVWPASQDAVPLAREVRPRTGPGQHFDLLLDAPLHTFVSFRAEGLEAFAGQSVYLIDHESKTTYNLHEQPVISLLARKSQTPLSLLLGDSSYIAAQRQALLSDEVLQNYPNPFNPTTTIQYRLQEGTHVQLKVYDLLGKEVATLVDGYQKAGPHALRFDASHLSSGVYLYRIDAGNFKAVRQMTVKK